MCGIAGFVHHDTSRPADVEVLRRMTSALAHRGPDGEGHFLHDNVALGHRRLSIIDTSTGHQPMSTADNQCVISFNGEIYNYIELRSQLEKLGYTFRTQSDTEVILYSYKHWGESCVQHFNGAWAFALWDASKQQLFCSRDRLGEKPFFYSQHQGSFVFASEIKSLFAYGVPRESAGEVLDAYLCFTYIPAPHTFFRNIFKLEAGYNLIVRENGISKTCYWDVPLMSTGDQRRDETNILDEFEHLFYDSVKLRMRSDVPFGAFLSGGLDSASVVAAMSEQNDDAVKTFTAGFGEQDFDERALALLVSKKFGTTHCSFEVGPDDAEHAMERLAHYYDEPFGDSSALPTYIISGLARQHVKVVLTGDGGDEVLSGYTIHQGEKFSQQYSRVPSMVRTHVLPGLMNGLKHISPRQFKSKFLRAENVLRSSALDFQSRLMQKQNGFRFDERAALIKSSGVRPAAEFIEEALKPASHLDSYSQLNYWLTKVSLPDDMLTKVDRASMAHSLEARLPFLDHRIVELMWSVSMDVRLKGYTRKHILRATMGRKLPAELLSARKRGFVVPLRDWMRNGTGAALTHRAEHLADKGVINRDALHSIISSHKRGDRDAANALWTLGMLSYSMK